MFANDLARVVITSAPPLRVHCPKCETEITHEQITRDMSPFLDSVGSARGFLNCPT